MQKQTVKMKSTWKTD